MRSRKEVLNDLQVVSQELDAITMRRARLLAEREEIDEYSRAMERWAHSRQKQAFDFWSKPENEKTLADAWLSTRSLGAALTTVGARMELLVVARNLHRDGDLWIPGLGEEHTTWSREFDERCKAIEAGIKSAVRSAARREVLERGGLS